MLLPVISFPLLFQLSLEKAKGLYECISAKFSALKLFSKCAICHLHHLRITYDMLKPVLFSRQEACHFVLFTGHLFVAQREEPYLLSLRFRLNVWVWACLNNFCSIIIATCGFCPPPTYLRTSHFVPIQEALIQYYMCCQELFRFINTVALIA